MNHNRVRTFLVLAVCCSIGLIPLQSQSVWPGDVTNNGLVNGIDMLHHGIAADATGPPREFPSPNWGEQPLPPPWSGNFANGNNFAFADCNGDGEVDDTDFEVIENNYGNSHSGMIPDVFQLGDPTIAPTLLLEAVTPNITPGGIVRLKLSLGDEAYPVSNFFGIVFTLHFDPAQISDQANNIRFRLAQNSFVNGTGQNRAKTFTKVEEESGTVEMTIMRQNLGTVDGFGEIGTFIVVMEDIILLDEDNAHFSIGNIKMIDPDLNEYLVASSSVDIPILGSEGNNENNLSVRHSAELSPEVQIHSNFSKGELWLEVDNRANNLEKIEIVNEEEEIVLSQPFNNKRKADKIIMHKYPKGNYILKIYKPEGVSEYLIVK